MAVRSLSTVAAAVGLPHARLAKPPVVTTAVLLLAEEPSG